MLNDITLGQYFPGNSLLHRLDPRVKLLVTFVYIIAIFIPKNWAGLAVAVLFLFVCVALSRLPVRLITKTFKPIVPLILLTSVLNVFYLDSGNVWWDAGFFKLTDHGVYTAIFIAIRILCLIAGSSLLTYTTTPTALTDGLERLLSPLRHLRVPVHELSMMMTIALRFIPSLIEETDKIMAAQKARGADMESGGMMQRIRAFLPVLIPLFVSSFRRAYDLATAMECRCYRGGEGRTRLNRLQMQGRDVAVLVVTAVFVAALIVGNVWLPSTL